MYTRPLLYSGLLAPVVFLADVLVESATRPDYSSWRHAISQLSLGPGWPVHGIVGTVLFAALAATALTLARHPRGRTEWSSWRPYSLATGLTVAATYPLTVVPSSLDQAGLWTNAPAGLTERVAVIAGVGWCALLAGRLLKTTARRPLDHATTASHA
jgi:hypothetical protein